MNHQGNLDQFSEIGGHMSSSNGGGGRGGNNFAQDLSHSSGSSSTTMSSSMTAGEIQMQMKQLQHGMGGSQNNSLTGGTEASSSISAPILRPSVSSSILQLARSTSKLLPSFSSFFGERKSTEPSVLDVVDVDIDGGMGSSDTKNNEDSSS